MPWTNLEGTWRLEGCDLDGTNQFTSTVTRRWLPGAGCPALVARRWLPGGHFLVHEMTIDGQHHPGLEHIGDDHVQGSLRSMLFSEEGPGPFCSFTLEHLWQLEGDALMIWHGEKGSPARFTGTIDRTTGVVDGGGSGPVVAIAPPRRGSSRQLAHPTDPPRLRPRSR